MIVQFLTGIGIVLFGIHILSSSFEKLCGAKIKKAINKYSSNRFSGTFFGATLTFLLQSSTASIILITGLTSAGIVTLFQSICLIFGSNIGSALSMIVVAFQSIDLVSYFGLMTLIGVFMRIIFKNNTVKNWGMCLCGFGLLFIGLSFMSSATAELRTSEAFLNFISSMSNPIVLILIGVVGTTILQSSLGMMAVVASMLGASVASSVMTVYSAAFIVYGMNIGTCVANVVVAATMGRQSLRAGLSHLIFNVFGTIIFSILSIWDWVTPLTSFLNNPILQIIAVNLIFNIVTCCIMLPLAKPLAKLLNKIIPDKKSTHTESTPAINTSVATVALVQLSQNANNLFSETANILQQAMMYVTTEEANFSTKLNQDIDVIIKQDEALLSKLLSLGGNLGEADNLTANKLNSLFVGIKKTNVNISKLIKSSEDGDKKYNFTQKQLKIMSDIQSLMVDNIHDMKKIMEDDYLQVDNGNNQTLVNNIIARLEKIVNKKIQAKQNVVQNAISNARVQKYTAFLNVINYFEQIDTNLTDIILEVLSSKNIEIKEEQLDLFKLNIN